MKLIKMLFKKNFFANSIIRWLLNHKNYLLKNYFDECKKRKKFDVWDVEEISKELKMYLIDSSPDGALYGISYWINDYFQPKRKLNYVIEHGLYLGDFVRDESIVSQYKGTITFSDYRQDQIKKKTNTDVLTIGPYIYYAKQYYSHEILELLKQKFGKTLLVFPPHALDKEVTKLNHEELIRKINAMKANYDTILVNFYYLDIQNSTHKIYEAQGFKVVSAGHKYDFNFLPRLKSIISIADDTLSTNVGTHVGYCVSLNKPHYIIEVDNKKSATEYYLEKDIEQRGDNYLDSYLYHESIIFETFNKKRNSISKDQQEICNYYWGLNRIKDKEYFRHKNL